MRRIDDTPMDPNIAASLEAIDATLAGEPVDPQHAEVAELALLLAADRPEMSVAFSRTLDDKVAARFQSSPARPRPRRWVWFPAVSAVGLAAIVSVVVVLSSRTPGSGSVRSIPAPTPPTAAGAGASGASRAGASGASSAGASGVAQAAAARAPGSLQPPTNGRKITQSAQLALSTDANRIDDVAQELFNVVGAENGIVSRSTVTQTGGADGYASFELSVPSSALADTMTKLSALPSARVASRTDSSQDVTSQYNDATARLADARALRTTLLGQLAAASSTHQIDSLKAQINDAEASITSDQAALRTLNHRIGYGQLSVTINAVVPVASGGGFTIGKGAHSAGRVLTVAAGVALIALAALVPIGLLLALAWWIASTVRRRRREQALDLA